MAIALNHAVAPLDSCFVDGGVVLVLFNSFMEVDFIRTIKFAHFKGMIQ